MCTPDNVVRSVFDCTVKHGNSELEYSEEPDTVQYLFPPQYALLCFNVTDKLNYGCNAVTTFVSGPAGIHYNSISFLL